MSTFLKRRSMRIKCVTILTIVFLLSFFTVTAFAATVIGSSWSFTVGSKEYCNYSKLSRTTNSSQDYFTTISTVECETSACASGELGAKPNVYKQNSNGTYTLVAAGVWRYSTGTLWGYGNGTAVYFDPSSGNYMGQGQTAVYHNGSYQRDWTYATPFITVS